MTDPETNNPREYDNGAEYSNDSGEFAAGHAEHADDNGEFAAEHGEHADDNGEYSGMHVGAGFLFSPGAGLLCSGRAKLGAAVNIGLFLAVSLFLCAAAVFGFFPVPGFLFLLLVTGAVWLTVAVFTKGEELRLPSGGWIWLSAVSAFSFWLPFVLAVSIGFGGVMQRTYMNNNSMMPQIHRGDCVLVNRLGYMFRRPDHGDLVMVEEAVEEKGKTVRRVYFARVVAVPGDRVQLSSGTTYVNSEPLQVYYPKKEMPDLKVGRSMVVYELPHGTAVTEPDGEPERWYPVSMSANIMFSQLNETELDDKVYFVYVDNRDNGGYQEVLQSFGTIHESWIKGQPRFVLYNTEADDTFGRFGYRLR